MCYKKSVERKTFLDAEAYCKSQGGHLARIWSEAENELVGSIGGSGHFWFGLWTGSENSCHPNKNKYAWTDGSPQGTSFDAWRTGEPDCCCGKGGLGALFNFEKGSNRWDDGNILMKLPFVCGILLEMLGKWHLNDMVMKLKYINLKIPVPLVILHLTIYFIFIHIKRYVVSLPNPKAAKNWMP